MSKTIGIDLGTTNSVVAFKDATVRVLTTGPDNQELCRSCVAVDASGSFIVGNTPYKNWKRYAPNIVVSIKRLMGAAISDPQVQKMQKDKDMYPYGIKKLSGGTEDSVAVVLNGREYTPEQISAEILRQIKNDASNKLNDEVTHAVITVPAYFNEKQKSATRKAAELAGLKVQRLLAEPTAAAISYGADKMSADEDKVFLVYDFGGGTFDLSILVASGGNFIESGTGGDRWLGGDDIDRLITEYVLAEAGKANGNIDIHTLINHLADRKLYAFQGELKNEVESAKKALSSAESVTISLFDHLETEDGEPVDIEVTLTRKKFEEMIRPLIQRSLDLIDELLEKTSYPIDAIDNILLVGGSSCIPLVRQMLAEKYGQDKILSSEKPMLAIAEGAAILSHSMGTESECPHCGKLLPVGTEECPYCHSLVTDVVSEEELKAGEKIQVSITTKHKYFIETRDDADNVSYSMIIDENEVLPNEVNKKFYTIVDNQKIVCVKLYSDAEGGTKEKLCTGFFTIPESLPVHSELQFTFRLDANETMSVKVRVATTGKTTNIVLGRGSLDQHCLDSISTNFDKVMNDSTISNDRKSEFMDKLQKTIDLISAGGFNPDSREWQDVEHSLETTVQVAMTKEEDPNTVYADIAKILLDNFGRFIRDEDKNTMRAELAKVETPATPMAKNEALEKLEKLTDRYGLFTHGFLFNIVGHNSSDPNKANRAFVVYNKFMAALNEHNVEQARNILSANEDLLTGLGPIDITGRTTDIGQ